MTMTRQNIVCISSIDWDFIWQGHQEIMATLAAQGNRVLFIENTGVRAIRVGDFPRVRSRIRNWWHGAKGFREERENLFVFSPVILPFPYSRVAQWVNAALLLRKLRRWIRAAEFHNPIVWTFLPTPLARSLIQGLDARLTIYCCIDDFRSSSHGAQRITRTEDQLLREADLVFVTSQKLRARAETFGNHVHLFPFGVNYEAFERVRLEAREAPQELVDLPRPVIGYIGGLHQWLDQRLVCAVADSMPEASVVLVGPRQTDVSLMEQRRNVHLLGPRSHAELPRYIKGFDVGLVPYALSDYTAHVYPTKLNEYLAMGTPVVATDLPEIRRFNDMHGGIVAIGTDPDSFVTGVRGAVGPASQDTIEQRLQVAKDNSWSTRIAKMSALIEEALDRRQRSTERWDVVLGRVYHNARRSVARAVVAFVVGYGLVFHTPVLWIVATPLAVATEPEAADAIVVFGGGVGESGRANNSSYQDRVQEAVALHEGGFAQNVVFSSGFVYLFEEAQVMKALAISEGVPAADIVLETRAGSTRENVLFVRDIAERQGWSRILLVSSPYHMRRATSTWRKLAPGIAVVPTPATRSQYYQHGVGASFEQVRGIAQEYVALTYYWAKGWI
jgi:uncharacterized SAM-binding protein YcdF (DUF218 family)/glycosyltransferase involved in cell wall biosynthesis